MLKKLFVYEWKAFSRLPIIINISLILITLIGLLSLFSPVWKTDNPVILALLLASVFFYIIALIAGPIMIVAVIAVRFYKHIYSDEGYLTHTLPVTPHQIIFSKLSVSLIWSIITSFVVCVSVFSLVIGVILAAADPYYTLATIYSEFSRGFNMFMKELQINQFFFTIYSILGVFIGSAFSILMLYAAISLGQLFSNHKILGSIICYIGLLTGTQIVTSLFINIKTFANIGSNTLYSDPSQFFSLTSTLITTLLASTIGVAAFYFITEYIMRKKLNLD